MAEPITTAIEPGLIARLSAGVRYVLTGQPNAWFGPAQPLKPVVPTAEQASVQGRQFDYPVGYNLRYTPRAEEAISFTQMRALADAYDMLRILIETRKDSLTKLRWTIKPKDDKKQPDSRCAKITDFLVCPDQEHDWADWLRLVLEDMLVLDAPAVYVRRTRGGDVYALEPIDGATIKRVIDERGRTPLPPDPAFQQILKGVPAIDYSLDELIYRPRNLRTHKIYGYGPVEQIIVTVNIALRRQANQLSYYTDGNTPNLIFGVPPEWNPDQIAKYQKHWEALNAGQSKHAARFVPGGVKPFDTKEQALKDEFDEWLARICCFTLGINPTPFIKQQNRAVANQAHEQSKEEGQAPYAQWVEGLMNLVIGRLFGFTDLEFAFADEEETDPATKSTVLDQRLRNGSMTINEARAETGDEPVEFGDEPMIYTGTGPVLLKDVINPPEPEPPPPLATAVPGLEPPKPDAGKLAKGKKKAFL